jgi:hypothetical protein
VSPTPTPTIIVASDGPNQVVGNPGGGSKPNKGAGDGPKQDKGKPDKEKRDK